MSKIIIYILVVVAIFLCIIVPQTLAFHAKEDNEIANKTKDYLTRIDYYYFEQEIMDNEIKLQNADISESEKLINALKKKKELDKKRAEKIENMKEEKAKKQKFNDTTGFDRIYMEAGEKYGIPWQILSAIHLVESGRSSNSAIKSYAGAQGPMQFLPSTFRRYGVDGDGDGVSNINDVEDAIHSAANYLKASGAHNSINTALFAYNRSSSYVNKVLINARSIGYNA
jgi:membrane-bound lytic murein transglycosylase B